MYVCNVYDIHAAGAEVPGKCLDVEWRKAKKDWAVGKIVELPLEFDYDGLVEQTRELWRKKEEMAGKKVVFFFFG